MSSPEILMMVKASGGVLAAESIVSVAPDDALMRPDFRPGFIMELRTFDFDVAIEDKDDSAGDDAGGAGGKPSGKGKKNTLFRRWLGGDKTLKKEGYPVELKPFSYTRQLDKASPQLFEMASTSQTLVSVSVVKRKTLGTGSDAVTASQGYLRFDFIDVLLLKIKWDLDEALVVENGEFICRKVKLQYRPQLPDGALGDIIPAEWSYESMTEDS